MNLVYLVGEPGVGKTTVVATLVDSFGEAVALDPIRGTAPARLIVPGEHRDPTQPAQGSQGLPGRLVEIGRRRPGGFSGTDALPMAVIGDACAYLTSGMAASEAPLVLVEGARLGNRRFLATARDAGWTVDLVWLAGEEAAAAHREARGSDQAASFIKGRRSAAANLVRAVEGEPGITTHVVEVSPATTVREATSRVARAVHHALTGEARAATVTS